MRRTREEKSNGMLERIKFEHTFFFQAEDGIRDIGVTGVQTCALPISRPRVLSFSSRVAWNDGHMTPPASVRSARHLPTPVRSEERRVGKECRFRWSPYH